MDFAVIIVYLIPAIIFNYKTTFFHYDQRVYTKTTEQQIG